MNAWLELVIKVSSMGLNFKKWLIQNGFISQWSVDGTTAVETGESKMEFAPLPLEKQIKGVNQNWLNWPLALFQVVGPHLHKTYHHQQISVAPLYIFTTCSIAKKQITGNEKNFWNCLDVLETWEGQNIFSVKWQKTNKNKKIKNKKKKTIDPHKGSRTKKEKGKDSENLQDMYKNHQGLQQKKRRNLQNILSVGYSNYSWYLPDISRKT